MSAQLDLDDVAEPHPLAKQQLAELRAEVERLRVGYIRYEVARRLTPEKWRDLWSLNLHTGKPFDEMIDAIAADSGHHHMPKL